MNLDIEKLKNSLSTNAKKAWLILEDDIARVAKEMGLTEEQHQALLQRNMASFKYADLEEQNKYNAKSSDVYAKRAIRRNKIEMHKLEDVYYEKYPEVAEFEDKVNLRLDQMEQERQKANSKTKKQAA